MSKLKNEHMEQDVLIEYSSRFLHFYRNNKGVVIGTGIGLLLSIALVIGYVVWSIEQEDEAQILLGQAEEYFMMGELQLALEGNDEPFEPGFIQIADNYSRTRAGNLATYYAAVVHFELGEYGEALSYMERFSLPEGVMGVTPVSFHASILSELNRYEEAGEKFLEAAEWTENESMTPYNLIEAAISFEAAGARDRAVTVLNRIIQEYPNSPQVSEAERFKGRLMASRS